MVEELESANDKIQEVKIKNLLRSFIVEEPVPSIHEPIIIKIPIKNCQRLLSTKINLFNN